MSVCDICGVIRNPTSGNLNKRTAESECKDCGVSIMAKSLFASLPHRTPRKSVVAQLQNDDPVTKGAPGNSSFLDYENFQGNFHEFQKAFSSHSHSHKKIVPFEFDVPSPDDLVSSGLHSSKRGSRADSLNFKPPKASSGTTENGATNAQSTVQKVDDSFPLVPKGKRCIGDEIVDAKNEVATKQLGSDSLFSSMPKPGVRSKFPKDSTPSIQLSDEMSVSSSALMTKGKNRSVNDSSSSSMTRDEMYRLSDNVNRMNVSYKSSSSVIAKNTKSNAQYQPDEWMLPDKADDTMTQLNLAIVGHVDSGKSTLSGRLLHLLGRITQKEMHKYEKESKLQGKGSFAFAWALDESPEERERGITMTVAVAYFDSKKFHVVVLDSPGHKDFVPNMISGATQADAAILVIDACIGAFEAGMDSKKGQTREHTQLVRSFGVDQIIVAINKMDSVGYSKDRFDLIKTQLGTFLRSVGFKDSSVTWVPLSVMENQNLVSAPSNVVLSSWYHGPCLLDAIDSFPPPTRDYSKPLLMPICDVIKLPSMGQVSASGKIEAGALRTGSKVLVMPSGDVGTVRSIERDSRPCSVARAGDNVSVSLGGIDGSNVIAGGAICHPDFPVAVAKCLELKVLVLDFATPILIGSQLEFHLYHTKEAARVTRIISLLDPKTGKVIKKAPRCLTPKQHAVIEVDLHAPICVLEFSNCKAIGRVSLRVLGRTIALGVVTKVMEEVE
ncbi:uncharacterized protein LOC126669143 isoform X2 [Mercurialis annua]|nr:uncharacterized protein LOC126669143 isoform X2 [Mercurialis annua]